MNEGVDTSQWPSARELRAWAEAKRPGIVATNGRLPRFLVLAWDKAHPDRPFVESQGHHGTWHGYCNKDCRCDRCIEAGAAYAHDSYVLNRDERDNALADDLAGG